MPERPVFADRCKANTGTKAHHRARLINNGSALADLQKLLLWDHMLIGCRYYIQQPQL